MSDAKVFDGNVWGGALFQEACADSDEFGRDGLRDGIHRMAMTVRGRNVSSEIPVDTVQWPTTPEVQGCDGGVAMP